MDTAHGITSMIHTMIHGTITMAGDTAGAGVLGIAGTEESGDGIILTIGHTGAGDQVGIMAIM